MAQPVPAAPPPTLAATPPPTQAPTPPGPGLSEQTSAALDLTTQPKAESSPIYAKWWFWTGIAAVVGGAVTATLLATRNTTQSACASETYPCATIK